LAKVIEIPRQQGRITSQNDSRYLQVHRANPQATTTQPLEYHRSRFIKLQDRNATIVIKMRKQSAIGRDLLRHRPCPGKIGHPTLHLFLITDHRRYHVGWQQLSQTMEQSAQTWLLTSL
jgi:hypothetical protein